MTNVAWEGPHAFSRGGARWRSHYYSGLAKKEKRGKENQWCLEGIKEWENRIQLASWSPRRITSPAHCFQMPCIFPCAASSQPHHWRGSRFQHPSTTRSLGKITRKYRDNKEMWQPKKRSETVLGLIWNARGSRGSMEPCHIGKLKSNQTSSHCMLLQTLSMRDHFPPLLRLCDLSVLYFTNCSWLSNPFLIFKTYNTTNGNLPWEPCRAFYTRRGFLHS